MIDEINADARRAHHHDRGPDRVPPPHKKCIVNQRELGTDAPSFALALKAALRQDPDVILVGEMRDLETISTALTAAETGHLVFATLHTQSAAADDRPHHRRLPAAPAGPGARAAVGRPAGRHDPAAAADRRRLRPRRRDRGARPDAGGAQPDPRGQDPPDLLRRCRPAAASACRRWTPRSPTLVRAGKITQRLAEARSSTPDELRRLLGFGGMGSMAA